MVLQIWLDAGGDNAAFKALNTQEHKDLRAARVFPHLDTCRRWIKIYQSEGHVLPKRATGNKFTQREIHGDDLVNLAFFRTIRPKAYNVEVRAYLSNRNPDIRPYSHSQVARAEKRLGLWLKAASSTSDAAYRPINLSKRRQYWGETYPRGINGVDVRDVIDIDEAQFKLESQNRKFGQMPKQLRCDARGSYRKGAPGVSLLMGISGDDIDPFEFHQSFTEGGTNLWRFYCYMDEFIKWLDVNRPGRSFCFTMDNLNIHKHPIILDLIEEAGHRIVFRAPYWSCDGAIEYVFNTIQTKLQMDSEGVKEVRELVLKMDDIIFEMTDEGYRKYFEHVGFGQ